MAHLGFTSRRAPEWHVHENWVPRPLPGIVCVVCGREAPQYYFHVIEFQYRHKSIPFPSSMEVFHVEDHVLEGSFPVCTGCAPACPRCGLARRTRPLESAFTLLHAQLHQPPDNLMRWGPGLCAHV
jgi:hypothetical protein